MYLKSLELQGFKSFPDKTLIRFGDDITAIVGPNGSGKSNISDAILWVLGEQSTKTLRGAKMEDVIFGGTQKRSAGRLCRGNPDPRQYRPALAYDADEVMVTRRYYRSGDGEYYINKQSARFKDINELFMDTGLGREGYSNIGQGRIDEILSLKSNDRREIFEEAAGISKYRHRKEETERKLLQTEDNLLRIGDKVSELELQLEPLRVQSEKAQKYLELKDELKGVEVAVWLDSLDRLSAAAKKAGGGLYLLPPSCCSRLMTIWINSTPRQKPWGRRCMKRMGSWKPFGSRSICSSPPISSWTVRWLSCGAIWKITNPILPALKKN